MKIITFVPLLAMAGATVLLDDFDNQRLVTRNNRPFFQGRDIESGSRLSRRDPWIDSVLVPRGIGRTSRSNSLVDLNRSPSPQPGRNGATGWSPTGWSGTGWSPAGSPSPGPHQRSPSPPAKISDAQQRELNAKLNKWSMSPPPGASPRGGPSWSPYGGGGNGHQHGTEMSNMGSRPGQDRAHIGRINEAMLSAQMRQLTIPKGH